MKRSKIIFACVLALAMGTLSSCKDDEPEVIEVKKITVDPESAQVAMGGTTTITVTALPENATNPVFEWSSDNTAVATVDKDGVVTGVAVGSANVTVKCGTLSKTIPVTVFIPLTDITLSPDETTLTLEVLFGVPGSAQYEATPVPENSTEVISWESSNTAIATVSETGLISAVAAGNAKITVKGSNGTVKKEISVTVNKIGDDPVIFDKKLFSHINLPNDYCQDRNSGWQITGIWDDVPIHAGGSAPTEEKQSITIDLGVTGNLAYFHLYQWVSRDEGYPPFCEANLKKFEIWGCETLDETGSWDSWTKLMDCEVIKPSGLPGEFDATEEDYTAGYQGQSFYNKVNYNVPVHYIRVKVLETWGGMNNFRIEEIALFGKQQ